MERTNYHTHTKRCKHAGGTELDYVKAALEKKLSVLGFSDHAPYPDDRMGMRMDYVELKSYIEEVLQLKEQYRKELSILLGLEIEFDPREMDYYYQLKEEMGIEYLLLGQHAYIDKRGETINIYSLEQTKDTSHYLEYANSLKDAMKTGLFPVIAHPDVIFINQMPWDKNCEEACDRIVEAAISTNTILEFNGNGIRRGKIQYEDGIRYPYPHERFWEKVAKANGTVIINSDCHSPDNIWDTCMDKAYELAQNWRLQVVNHFPLK